MLDALCLDRSLGFEMLRKATSAPHAMFLGILFQFVRPKFTAALVAVCCFQPNWAKTDFSLVSTIIFLIFSGYSPQQLLRHITIGIELPERIQPGDMF